MREIKFRAWDKLHKKMLTEIEVMRFDSSESGVEQVYGYNPSKEATSDANWVALDRLVVMQYTGLKDKNGKEIYEGDVIKFKTKSEGVCVEEVFWSDYLFGWAHTYSDRPSKQFWNSEHIPIEVIGNVYENPELLK